MIDYIIVGQGIAGTVLHRKLTLAGYTSVIIDEGHQKSSSVVAAGLINPITGRKYVKSWRIEDFLPVARTTYDELSQFLGSNIYKDVVVHRALYSIKDENTWYARMEDPLASQYILSDADTSIYRDTINNVLSYGSLRGMQVNLSQLLTSYREQLDDTALYASRYDHTLLAIHRNHVSYDGLDAKAIIFAEGYQAMYNPLWSNLPFQPVKGEVLLVKIEGNPFKDVLRHKIFITPLPNDLYWVGSGYEWDFENEKPTTAGREKLIEQLDSILKVPYEIIDHKAGIRPAVKGRKPFLGRHSDHENVYIFNGMGTKGTSLAPYWAEHFIAYLEGKTDLHQDVDIGKWYAA